MTPVVPAKVEDYQSVSSAVFALMRYSVGDFNYYKLQDADPVAGPLFFFIFIFLMVWVLVVSALVIFIIQTLQPNLFFLK